MFLRVISTWSDIKN